MTEPIRIENGKREFLFADKSYTADVWDDFGELEKIEADAAGDNSSAWLGKVVDLLASKGVTATRTEALDYRCAVHAAVMDIKKKLQEKHGLQPPTE